MLELRPDLVEEKFIARVHSMGGGDNFRDAHRREFQRQIAAQRYVCCFAALIFRRCDDRGSETYLRYLGL